MQRCLRGPFSAVLMLLVFGVPLPAQEKKIDGKALDKTIQDALREVINHGAHLFNDRADYAGCYRAFETGLITIKPFLDHRPDLQKTIQDGLAKAAEQPRVVDRAFTLRFVL